MRFYNYFTPLAAGVLAIWRVRPAQGVGIVRDDVFEAATGYIGGDLLQCLRQSGAGLKGTKRRDRIFG